ASVGNWENTSDANAIYKPYSAGISDSSFKVYTDGIKIGDAPQTQFTAGLTVFPVEGMDIQAVYRFYDNYYADWTALSRGDASDNGQSWQIPSYNIVDLHFSYKIPTNVVNMTVFAHVFNLFNELYVQDATDNSKYNGYSANGTNHSADDAEIYPGLPRSFNLGLSVSL
ncbi:MAG: TonB-dependent receptor, partial [Calditrichaceae bacterium]